MLVNAVHVMLLNLNACSSYVVRDLCPQSF